MSGVAASFDQATGILKLLCETKWTKAEMQRRFFARWGLLRDIAVALDDPQLSEEQVRAMHPLFYKKKTAKTFSDLLADCRQSRVNPHFNEENFPLEPVAPDEADWEVYEHHFEETVTGEEAFRRLEEMGYRLCGPRRAMEFIAAHPDLQLDRSVIVTARWLDSDGGWCAPIFYRHDGRRGLNLDCLGDDDFGSGCGWLVLHKRAA